MNGKRCDVGHADFLSVLSHELRNPLAALGNSLYVLAKTQADADARTRRALALMERQLRHMTALVDNLAEAARLGGCGMELHPSEVDLVGLVHDACHDLAYLFIGRDVELRLELPAETLMIWADATRLRQLVGNLLQNAAQFTSSGSVVVGLELQASQRQVWLRVRDTGIGLDAELLQRLFQPLAPDPVPLTRAGGLGLGLVLVKGIVDLHGGAVRAESAGPGRGSTFVVELPWPGTQRPRLAAIE